MPNPMFPALSFSTRAVATALAAFCLAIASPRIFAATAPATNDLCASAITVPPAGPFPYLSPVMDVFNATTNGDPYLPDVWEGNTNVTRSVWFKFTPAATALYTLSFGPDTATAYGDANTDSVMAIYTNSTATCDGTFTPVAGDDDHGGIFSPMASAVSTNLQAGTTYYIVTWVGRVSAVVINSGPVNVQLRVTKPEPPANDDCTTAETIPGSGPFPYFTSTHDNTLATEADDPFSSCAPDGRRSVWFKFVPTLTTNYVITTADDSGTTVGATAVAVYHSSSGNCSTLTHLACDGSTSSRAVFPPVSYTRGLTNGHTYFIVVWDNSPDPIPGETSVRLKIVRAGPPTVTALDPINIASTSAVLRAIFNANGGAVTRTRYWFEWGTTTNYGSSNTPRLLNASPRPVTVDVTINTNIFPFTPGVTYHYRGVCTNESGWAYGADRTFRWSNMRPTLTAPVYLGVGAFRFNFAGQPSHLYCVLDSTNLVDWTDNGPPRETAPGLFEFTRGATNPAPWRFFKVLAP